MGRRALSGTVLLMLLFMGVLASVLVVAPSKASTASEPPEVEWDRTYGGADDDRANCVQQTRDGGYILAGYTKSFGLGGEFDAMDFWLVKISPTGTIQWNRTFGVAGYNDIAHSVQQTSDGGYIVAGAGYTVDSEGDNIGLVDAWLVKTSSTGALEWKQAYGTNSWDYARSVLQASDGGYVFAGISHPHGDSKPSGEFWLVETSAAGVMEWNQTYGGEGYDEAYSVQQTSDGGYIIAGFTSSATKGRDFLLVKTSAAGAMEWSQMYGGTGHEEAYSVQQTSDGGYIITGAQLDSGFQPTDAWVVKTSSTGVMQWNKIIGGDKKDCLNSVLQTSDGGYMLAGYTSSFGGGGWLVKTSSTGTVEWNQTYPGSASCIQKTRDGGYIIGGFGGWPGDFWLLKLGYDADGDGLLNDWERNGIDYPPADGIIDLDLPALGADWQHKDLFVEVDYMGLGHRPDQGAMDDVVAAFANAPIENPDDMPGIKLHVDLDDQIPHQDVIKAFTDFDSIKSSYFGTAAERNSPNGPNILDAKKLAYHYCLFVHQYSTNSTGTWEATNSSGIAECPGNDFIVSLGTFTYGWGTRDQQAGTFMHELGHNLNLRHGGGDDINYKPNYLSIMSYSFQFADHNPWRSLDYSRRELPYLHEGSLDEPLGIQAGIQEFDSWGYTIWNDSKKRFAFGLVNGPLDWNGDGNLTYLVQANINNFTGWDGYNSPANEMLLGYDDWASIKLNFQDTEGFADGVHSQVADHEITWEIVEAMRASRLAMHEVAVFNLTSSSPIWGQGSALSVTLTLGNLGGSDENVNVTVYANSTVIASSSLIIRAGNLTTTTLPCNVQVLTPGNYKLKAIVSPVAGEGYMADNTITGGIVTVASEIPESPVSTDNYDGLWHTSDFTITISATDNVGVNATYYRINGGQTKTVSANGQPLITTEGVANTLEYWSVDTAGNEELPHKMLTQIKLDKTTPAGSLQINNGSAYANSTTVNLKLLATDSVSGVSQMRFNNDYGTWSSWEPYATSKSWNLTAGDGAKNVFVQYRDFGGLSVTAYQLIALDLSPPIASAGQNQTVFTGTSVTFNGTGSTGNNAIVSYLWDFGDGTTGTGVTPSHTYANLGVYTVRLNVKDAAGNSAASSATVTIEVVIPEFSSALVFTAILILLSALAVLFRRKRVIQTANLN